MWIDIVIAAVWGLVLLVALWPTQSTAKRLLKRWEVPDPTPDQLDEGIRYLKRRRLLYPVIFAGLALAPNWGQQLGQLVVIVLGGTLLAELLALRQRRDALRVATLTPRGLFDFASKWVLGSYVVIVVLAAAQLGVNRQWSQILWLSLSAVAVAVIVWAAVARPASGEEVVDLALRTRSVHVSAGLGAALAGVLAAHWMGMVGILAWIAMSNTTPKHVKITR
ncbi:hypothetical protein OG205_33235 [Lentzea sp. NBC_00516]|uniref:hypothetical protein n=1 Tax=Lentzea sp. NBC_00516 TaxID=2903582 RepID=UPI002E8225FB|nr:hypothetical protein [Lentzea sp. NBC_00516]WUD22902.1 hypothetical protein OG205_33235 [Lentzea sp. NBC_00516]